MKSLRITRLYLITLVSLAVMLLAACGEVSPTPLSIPGGFPVSSPAVNVVPTLAPATPTATSTTAVPVPTTVPTTVPVTTAGQIPANSPVPTTTGTVTPKIGTPFGVKMNQPVKILPDNLEIKFLRVLEDSRCPVNVACYWSGQLIIEVSVGRPGAPATPLILNNIEAERNKNQSNFENYNLALVSATPVNYSSPAGLTATPGVARDYEVQLLVTKVPPVVLPAEKAVLGQRIEVKYQQTAVFATEGLSLKFDSLLSDSRCPKSTGTYYVACAVAGQASIQLKAGHAQTSAPLVLTLPGLTDDTTALKTGAPGSVFTVTFEGYRVQLVSLEPQPEAGPTTTSIKASVQSYRVVLLVTKL